MGTYVQSTSLWEIYINSKLEEKSHHCRFMVGLELATFGTPFLSLIPFNVH
jgi:hypothetical protein